MVSGEGTDVQLLRESRVVDHSKHGLPGLVSMFGVRYTTARQTAQEAVDAVFHVLGHRPRHPAGRRKRPSRAAASIAWTPS
jgi:glycerol-3-phosphate dehydrogenase